MPRPFPALLFSLALLCAAMPASAQKFQPKSIQFKGDPEYSDKELLAAANLKLGTVYTSAEMNDHSKLLMDSGVFQNLTYKFDGVDLTYSLIPAPNLYAVRLENLPLAAGPELDAKLHDRFPLYHGKVPAEGGLLESVRGALEDLLAAQGIKATITPTPYTDMATHKVSAMSFAITDPPVLIGDLRLDPASPALEPKAQEILSKQSGSAYALDGSSNQIETNLSNFYRDKGYLEVTVKALPQLTPVVAPDAVRIPFTVSFTPGPLYKVSAVKLAPGLLVTQADFDHQSGIHPGDLADHVRITENWQYVARQYHNKGYMKAVVKATQSLDHAQGTVSYAVNVDPGPVYAMGTLHIDNVSDELRNTMLAAWKMPQGSVFNESVILSFLAVDPTVNPTLARVFASVKRNYSLTLNDETHTVDLIIKLEKR